MTKQSKNQVSHLQGLNSGPRMRYVGPSCIYFLIASLIRTFYYFSGSWVQIYSHNHLITTSPMMTLLWNLSTSTFLTSTYTYPFSTGLVSRSPSQKACIIQTTDSHLSTSLYALLVLAIRTIEEFC